jgi:hypothetical protein
MKSCKKPIVVGLSGGLGNQLFQYAAGRALSLKLGLDLVLDTTWFLGHPDRIYALEPFSINAKTYSGNVLLPKWIRRLECRLARRWADKRLGVSIYREPHFHFDGAYPLVKHPVYLEGYWQSERYFLEYKEIILRELTLKGEVTDQFKLIETHIQSSDAICVHIRRGDYVSNPIVSQVHGLCSLDYVYEGIKEVSKDLLKPHCFIFSDDPEWVKENLTLDLPFTIIDIAKPHEVHLDLGLMSQCKHFVIANSSLSWWGAWLSPYPLKRIVAPLNWFANSKKRIDDLIPRSWVRL